MDLRTVAVEEIEWITGNARVAEVWVQETWLAVARRDDGWMLARARLSGPGGAAIATGDFAESTMMADATVVAGAGVIARPATTARVEGQGARDVLATTGEHWLVGLARDDAKAPHAVTVHLVDEAGAPAHDPVTLNRR